MVELPVLIDVPASVHAAYNSQNAEKAIKTREDLKRYQKILEATRPDLIIECGTWGGASALWFSRFTQVVTIDIVPRVDEKTLRKPGILWIIGSSTDPAIVSAVTKMAEGRRVMVILDSDHRAEHVRAEMAAYGPLVAPGCYMVVEDGIVRWMDSENYPGPLDAIEDFLPGNPDWVRDEETEQMFSISMHPAGWLRRRI